MKKLFKLLSIPALALAGIVGIAGANVCATDGEEETTTPTTTTEYTPNTAAMYMNVLEFKAKEADNLSEANATTVNEYIATLQEDYKRFELFTYVSTNKNVDLWYQNITDNILASEVKVNGTTTNNVVSASYVIVQAKTATELSILKASDVFGSDASIVYGTGTGAITLTNTNYKNLTALSELYFAEQPKIFECSTARLTELTTATTDPYTKAENFGNYKTLKDAECLYDLKKDFDAKNVSFPLTLPELKWYESTWRKVKGTWNANIAIIKVIGDGILLVGGIFLAIVLLKKIFKH